MHSKPIPITPSHPFYEDLIKNLNMRPDVAVTAHMDYPAMMVDYNALPIGGFIGFLYFGKTEPSKRIEKALSRRGIRPGKSPTDDVSVFSLPVLTMEATALIATSPTKPVHPAEYDGVTAVDETIMRRADNTLNSESLPQIKNVWQVYLYKKTHAEAELEAKGRGRPKKMLTT